jgi:hypothetical protein
MSLNISGSFVDDTNPMNGNIDAVAHIGIQGPPGPQGSEGGYYIPRVEQIDANQIQFEFSRTDPDMPAVDPVQVKLPQSGGQEPLSGTTYEIKPSQVAEAISAGRLVLIMYSHQVLGLIAFTSFNVDVGRQLIYSSSVLTDDGMPFLVLLGGSYEVDKWEFILEVMPSMSDIPTDDYINGLIDAKLKGQPSSGGFGHVVQDTPPEDTSLLWVDPDDNSDDGFQEAVNTALAQAKASGEFDGADGQPGEKGDKGDKGDPGNDYVLTPADKSEIAELASELVEVPEGGGIAVTGAKVGQTVKIAEVDENGVPTAWESVDFPSGGSGGEKPYELIIDSTVPEDCERVIFREDLNGNEFEITDFVVWFDGYDGSNINNLSIFLRTHGGYLADNSEQYYYNGPLANISCRADFNFAFKATKIGVNAWHILYPAVGDSQHIENTRMWVQTGKSESVKQIAVIVTNASSGEAFRITSGTRIRVWGRRA